MTCQGSQTRLGLEVPDLDGVIHGARDQFLTVKLKTSDTPRVALQDCCALPTRQIPDSNVPIKRPCRDLAPLHLHAHDPVSVAP